MRKKVITRLVLVALVFVPIGVCGSCSDGGSGHVVVNLGSEGLAYEVESVDGDTFIVIAGPAPWVGNLDGFTLSIPSEINGIPVDSIEEFAFKDNLALRAVSLADGVSLGYDCFAGCANLVSVTLPDTMTYLTDGAFVDCASLASIDLPASLTGIGNHAFAGCASLGSIEIPSGVRTIYVNAFGGCTSLKTVVLPEGLVTVHAYILSGCSALTGVILPSTVTSIGDGAFYDCPSLLRVYAGSSSAPEIGWAPFGGNDVNRKFYVPADAVAAWTADPEWIDAGYASAVRARP